MVILSSPFIALFFLLIIITGGFTSVTDLRHKKIKNGQMIIIAVAAVILIVIKGISDKSLPMLQLSSFGCAIIIAWVFYKNDLWRGGDAKLFTLYSLLMPATFYESRIFLPSIALFANAFIIALIYLGLLFIRDSFTNPKLITENILKNFAPSYIIKSILMTLCVSWIIFPLFRAGGLAKYGFLSFLSFYLIIASLGKQLSRVIYNKFFAVTAFVCGLFLQYKFSPGFFLWERFSLYLSTVIIYSVFSIFLYRGTKGIAESNERIPFSPFLFLGCLSSYTPFLWWIMSFQHSGK
jgi:Flp pilus assembly protein protease CpaA